MKFIQGHIDDVKRDIPGRCSHSSTSQLNLSSFVRDPIQRSPQKVLALRRKADECKPLIPGKPLILEEFGKTVDAAVGRCKSKSVL